MCEVDAYGVYVCDLTVNGDSTDATLTSIYYATSGNWETWGTDADGNDYCCNIAPQNAAKYIGGSYDDVMDLNYDNGTVYHLTNASVDMFGNDGEDDLSGADNTTVWDYIEGGADDDVIQGLAGDDKLIGDDCPWMALGVLTGNDLIYGGDGEDFICGGSGDDTLYGDAGKDEMDGQLDEDVLHGGSGDDVMSGGAGADIMYGDAGNDGMDGNRGTDTMWGGADNDTMFGDEYHNDTDVDLMKGEDGVDTMDGGNGADQICGGDGDDVLNGGNGDYDQVYGGSGSDSNVGGDGTGDDCEALGADFATCETTYINACPW